VVKKLRYLGKKRGREPDAPFTWHREAPARTGAASRAPVGRASHVVRALGDEVRGFGEAPLPVKAARKLVYVGKKGKSIGGNGMARVLPKISECSKIILRA
jgi:hypothetical protein